MKQPVSLPLTVRIILLIVTVGMGSILLFAVLNGDSSNASLYTTGTRVIPTIVIPTAPAHCDPAQVPGQYGGVGVPAIKPHLCTIPTFTEQDVRNYISKIKSFSSFRIQQVSPHFTVIRILFASNDRFGFDHTASEVMILG